MKAGATQMVEGCVVTIDGEPASYQVIRMLGTEVVLAPLGAGGEKRAEVRRLRSGFRRFMPVQDVPRSRLRKSLGEGTVIATRTIGYRDQVLVELQESGQRIWFPFETLRFVQDVKQRFCHLPFRPDEAERFRLRTLAYALEHWNANTGALSRLDIDPLPHQIKLVHDILASGTLNWLIADDVGLGKTIEVGMLIHALLAQRAQERVLIVCPAGLTRQWKEELTRRFGIEGFRIYGEDFKVHDLREWGLYPLVIGSLDRLKAASHLDRIKDSGQWDLIVFDEAHRLTRSHDGNRYRASQRFKLAAELRRQTDSLLLLSATPHQGRTDLFEALLELLRPDWKSLISHLEHNPGLIREIVYRNRKSQVTDLGGEFVFRGQRTTAVNVETSDIERRLDAELREYLARGYDVAQRSGAKGRAIGFVMTTYRKLSASSPAALRASLARRLSRLLQKATDTGLSVNFDDSGEPTIADERFAGEAIESAADGVESSAPFFAEEVDLLHALVLLAKRAEVEDTKRGHLLDNLIPKVLAPDESLLVFTEYRGTLEDLRLAIAARYGEDSVVLIHGQMSLDERMAAVGRFTEGSARFLLSTEAGGEGLNLHRRCHTVVNYDLPWNPMRLVQRVGRVYRYGQTATVEVFNMCSLRTLDGDIIANMYQRIDSVITDLWGLGSEFSDGRLRFEIFGDIVSLADLESILERARSLTVDRTQEEIDAALERAQKAKELQDKVLAGARSYDAQAFGAELRVDSAHLMAFVTGMLEALGGMRKHGSRDGAVVEMALSPELQEKLNLKGASLRYTHVRSRAVDGVRYLDFDEPLCQHMLSVAKSHEFGGHHASVAGLDGTALIVSRLRWQNEQGKRQHEELVVLLRDDEGEVERNPAVCTKWLLEKARPAECAFTSAERIKMIEDALTECDDILGQRSNEHLHPQQVTVLAAAVCAMT